MNANANNIIFTIKDKKLSVSVVTLSAKDDNKLSKLFSKGFEKSVYLNEYKTKSENKNMTDEYRYFLKSTFVGVNGLFVLVYTYQDANAIEEIIIPLEKKRRSIKPIKTSIIKMEH